MQRAADEGLTHLGPDEVQIQPYYKALLMPVAKPVNGCLRPATTALPNLEAELSTLETQVARLLRQANDQRTGSKQNEAEARRLDGEREQLLPRVTELQEQIAAQTDVLAAQLREVLSRVKSMPRVLRFSVRPSTAKASPCPWS